MARRKAKHPSARWQRWRTRRTHYWRGEGMEPDLASRWACAEQLIRMRLGVLFGDDCAERLTLTVNAAGQIGFDLQLDETT